MPPQEDTTAPAAWPTRTVRAGDLVVGVIDSGSGTPLVLVHGGESDRTQFNGLRAHLGDDIRVISYDQRDSGVTVNPPEPYTLEQLADDLVHLLDALELRAAHLLGASFGGVVAQHTALRHPERVASLILVGTAPSYGTGGQELHGLLSLPADELRRRAVEYFYTPAGQAAARGRAATLSTRTPEQSARRHRVAQGHDLRERLVEITAPTLIVHGTDDVLTPYSGAELMEQRIPNARLRPIEGGRHALVAEFPGEVAALVREFLGVDA